MLSSNLLTYIPLKLLVVAWKVSPISKSPVLPVALLIEVNDTLGRTGALESNDSKTP